MADSDSYHARGEAVQSHRCKSIALHEVIPGTVAASVDVGDLHAMTSVLADFSLPLTVSQSPVARFVDFDTGPPPNDLVITLHRLVI
jgi:hypothetical protein